MKLERMFGVCVLMCTLPVPLWSQSHAPRVTLSGRMHFQWNSTSVDPDETTSGAAIAPSTFEHRRVRLAADARINEWIRGRIEPEFAMGQLRLRQVWMALDLDDSFTVRAGQFKKPFNLINLTSGSEVPVIERGMRIRSLEAAVRREHPEYARDVRGEALLGEYHSLLEAQRYTTYDMGVMLEGRHGSVAWNAGVFNGHGADTRDDGGALSGAARVTWRTGGALPLQLGGGWSRRALNWPGSSSTETRTGDAFVADVQLGGFRRGVWVLAEASTGDNLATGERFVGGQTMAAWFVGTRSSRIEGWEPALRLSYGDPDRTLAGDEGVLLTPGLNLYFQGRNRLMLNWDVYMPRGDGVQTQHAARAQINLEF
jgi:hypothetical protein